MIKSVAMEGTIWFASQTDGDNIAQVAEKDWRKTGKN